VRELEADSDEKGLVPPRQRGGGAARAQGENVLADFYSADIRRLVENEMLEDRLAGRRRASEVTVSVRMNRERERERERGRGRERDG
jgi:hypothetical protein